MRKKCRRKVYQKINPIQYAIEGAAITPERELDKLRQLELNVIEAFFKGEATEAHWHDILAMQSITVHLGKNGVGPEVLETCRQVKVHLDEAMDRFKRIGKMGTTGPGLQSFRDLFEYHDLQRQSISRGEYERAIHAATIKIRFGKPEQMGVV